MMRSLLGAGAAQTGHNVGHIRNGGKKDSRAERKSGALPRPGDCGEVVLFPLSNAAEGKSMPELALTLTSEPR